MKYIYHGTNTELLDDFLVSGTFFTEDIEIALAYGTTLYVIDYDKYKNVFSKTFEEHYVSHTHIPLEYLKKLKEVEK